MKIKLFFIIASLFFNTNCLLSQNKIKEIDLFLEQNKLEKASAEITAYFKNDTSSVDYLFFTGRLERKKGNNQIAENYFRKCLLKDSTYSKAYGYLAIIFYLNNDHLKAMDLMNKAIQLDPKNMDFYNERSAIYYELKDYENSLLDLKKAYAIYPNDVYYIHNIGTALNALDRFEEAIIYFNKADKINSKEPRNHYDRGIAYYNIDKPKKAIRDYKKVIKFNNKADISERLNIGKVYQLMSLAYNELNRVKKSNTYLKKAESNGWTGD